MNFIQYCFIAFCGIGITLNTFNIIAGLFDSRDKCLSYDLKYENGSEITSFKPPADFLTFQGFFGWFLFLLLFWIFFSKEFYYNSLSCCIEPRATCVRHFIGVICFFGFFIWTFLNCVPGFIFIKFVIVCAQENLFFSIIYCITILGFNILSIFLFGLIGFAIYSIFNACSQISEESKESDVFSKIFRDINLNIEGIEEDGWIV